MSRIGKNPVTIPEGVEVTLSGQDLKAKGKLGVLELRIHDEVSASIEEVANDEGKTSKIVTLSPKSTSRDSFSSYSCFFFSFSSSSCFCLSASSCF